MINFVSAAPPLRDHARRSAKEMRYITKEARLHLNQELGIKEDPYSQDWELEYADADRIDEFLAFYKKKTKNDDERFALMGLILGSLEDLYARDSSVDATWKKIKEVLEEETSLHYSHIEDYYCAEAESDDECFPITPFIREIKI